MKRLFGPALLALLASCGLGVVGSDPSTNPEGANEGGPGADGGGPAFEDGSPNDTSTLADGMTTVDAPFEIDGAPDAPVNIPTCATGGPACATTAACENGACVDVASTLVALRVNLPCLDDPFDDFCNTGQGKKSKSITLGGTAGKTYSIGIRVRGVVEQKTFNSTSNGNAAGTNASFFAIGGNPDTGNWNNYSLAISQPQTTYRLNKGSSGNDYCNGIDYTATIRAQANAVIELYGDSPNEERSARNRTSGGQAIIVNGVPPAPNPYDGQFVQIDVESVALSDN